MAIYHAHASVISRSGVGTVVAHSAYIAGEKRYDERTGIQHDYRSKGGEVLERRIVLPDGEGGELYLEGETLWNAVEKFEDKIANDRYRGHTKDPLKHQRSLKAKEKFLSTAFTGFKFEVSLPLEITKEEKKDLALRLSKELFAKRKLIAEYAIHDKEGNPHVHFLVVPRVFEGGDFSARKFRFTNEVIREIRKEVADVTNGFAKEKGYDFRIDHRSLVEQGIERAPTKHEGIYGRYLGEKSRIQQENKLYEKENLALFLKRPEELIKAVFQNKVVFKREDLEREIEKRAAGDMETLSLLQACVASLDVEAVKGFVLKKANQNRDPYLEEKLKGIIQSFAEGTLRGKGIHRVEGVSLERYSPERALEEKNASDEGFYGLKEDYEREVFVRDILRRVTIQSDRGEGGEASSFEGDTSLEAGASLGRSQKKGFMPREIFKEGLSFLEKSSLGNLLGLSEKEGRGQNTLLQAQSRLQHVIQEYEAEKRREDPSFKFSEKQKQVLYDLVRLMERNDGKVSEGSFRYASLIGNAGTGKTTIMGVMKAYYEGKGMRVLGTSFQGKAVAALSSEIGVEGYTLDKLIKEWRHIDRVGSVDTSLLRKIEQYELDAKTVLILDEGGMTSRWHVEALLRRVSEKGATLLVVGDPSQIKPIDRGDLARLLFETNVVTLDEMRRQREGWQLDASRDASEGEMTKALSRYEEKGLITYTQSLFSAKMGMVSEGARLYEAGVSFIALAFRNEDAQDLNLSIRHQLQKRGLLGESHSFMVEDMKGEGSTSLSFEEGRLKDFEEGEAGASLKKLILKDFGAGDKIIFRRNDMTGYAVRVLDGSGRRSSSTKGIVNGTVGTIREIKEGIIYASIGQGRTVVFSPREYAAFDYGYASTINLSQGSTYEKVLLLLDNREAPLSLSNLYVGMTRHRESLSMYASASYAKEFKELVSKITSPLQKLSFEEVKGDMKTLYDRVRLYKTLDGKIASLREAILKDLKPEEEFASHKEAPHLFDMTNERKALGIYLHEHWNAHATYANALGLKKETLEIRHFGRERILSHEEKAAKSFYEAYRKEKDPLHKEEMANEICAFPDLYRPLFKRQWQEVVVLQKTYESRMKGERTLKEEQRHHDERTASFDGKTLEREDPRGITSRDTVSFEGFVQRIQSSLDMKGFLGYAFGEGKRSGGSLRYGPKGHLAVDPRTGVWTNFKEGVSGSLLGSKTKPGLLSQSDLYRNTGFRESLAVIKDFVGDASLREGIEGYLKDGILRFEEKAGLGSTEKSYHERSEEAHDARERDAQEHSAEQRDAEAQNTVLEAQEKEARFLAQVNASLPQKGTVVETYLRGRGIKVFSEDVRTVTLQRKEEGSWISKEAMLGVIRDQSGNIQGIQTTLLTKEGFKDVSEETPKRIQGKIKGGFTQIQKDVFGTNRVILAEGIETALSLKEAGIYGEIRAVLGVHNFKSQGGLSGKEVFIAADNDTHKENTVLNKTLEDAREKLSATLIMPNTPGDDFNDVLQKEGVQGIREVFAPYLDIHQEREKSLSYKGHVKKGPSFKEYREFAKEANQEITERSISYVVYKDDALFQQKVEEKILDHSQQYVKTHGTLPQKEARASLVLQSRYETLRESQILSEIQKAHMKEAGLPKKQEKTHLILKAKCLASLEGTLLASKETLIEEKMNKALKEETYVQKAEALYEKMRGEGMLQKMHDNGSSHGGGLPTLLLDHLRHVSFIRGLHGDDTASSASSSLILEKEKVLGAYLMAKTPFLEGKGPREEINHCLTKDQAAKEILPSLKEILKTEKEYLFFTIEGTLPKGGDAKEITHQATAESKELQETFEKEQSHLMRMTQRER